MRSFYHEGMVEVTDEDGAKETLHLVCNFRAIDAIESLTGQTMTEILPQLTDPPASLAGKVLWGLLLEKHPGVTLDEAAGVGFGPDGPSVGVVMGDVLRRAFNIGGEDKKPANPRKPRGRSNASSKSG